MILARIIRLKLVSPRTITNYRKCDSLMKSYASMTLSQRYAGVSSLKNMVLCNKFVHSAVNPKESLTDYIAAKHDCITQCNTIRETAQMTADMHNLPGAFEVKKMIELEQQTTNWSSQLVEQIVILGEGSLFWLANIDELFFYRFGFALAWYIAGRITFKNFFTRPSLVNETSLFSMSELLKHPIQFLKRLQSKPLDALRGVIVRPKLEERLRDIAIATKNTKQNQGLYRSILMHGAPGTGKKLSVKKLAQHSGMDYAIIKGADVLAKGRDAGSELDKLFYWASKSPRGMVLFFEDAGDFLGPKESSTNIHLPQVINKIVEKLEDRKLPYMIVLANSTPLPFDPKILQSLDEKVEFTLPGLKERKLLLLHYFYKLVFQLQAKSKKRFKCEQWDYGADFSLMAEICDGMSGRDISQLAETWKAEVDKSKNGVLTKKIVLDQFESAVHKHNQKMHWLSK